MDVRGRTSIGDVAMDTPPATTLREVESETFSVASPRDWLAALEGG